MCDKNTTTLNNIDFSQGDDSSNWFTDSAFGVSTVDGQLLLKPSALGSVFSRPLNSANAANNRVRLALNLDVYRPDDSTQAVFETKVRIFTGQTELDVFTIRMDNMFSQQRISHFFERVYEYDELDDVLSIRFTTTKGYQNELYLDNLIVEDYNYCDDDLRMYFHLSDVLGAAKDSALSAIRLRSWKVADVETLTPAFFNENDGSGHNPVQDWYLASAEIDGTDRIADLIKTESFNPFISEWGLQFSAVNYYDGKPTGTTSGSDYGQGLLEIGIGYPKVANETLQGQNGVFFIDIDFTKSLYVEFDVLVKYGGGAVDDNPSVNRRYVLSWDFGTCTGSFRYTDMNTGEVVDQSQNGFLSGLTREESDIELINCGDSYSFKGEKGVHEVAIDFGSDIGSTGIDYDAKGVPNKFDIVYDGQTFSTGWVGHSDYDQYLLSGGVPQSEINTGDPSTAQGQLRFTKNAASPKIAILRVHGLSGELGTPPNEWSALSVCPTAIAERTVPSIDIWMDRKFFRLQSGTYTFDTMPIIKGDNGSVANTSLKLTETNNGTLHEAVVAVDTEIEVPEKLTWGTASNFKLVADGDLEDNRAVAFYTNQYPEIEGGVFNESRNANERSIACDESMSGEITMEGFAGELKNEVVYTDADGVGADITLTTFQGDVVVLKPNMHAVFEASEFPIQFQSTVFDCAGAGTPEGTATLLGRNVTVYNRNSQTEDFYQWYGEQADPNNIDINGLIQVDEPFAAHIPKPIFLIEETHDGGGSVDIVIQFEGYTWNGTAYVAQTFTISTGGAPSVQMAPGFYRVTTLSVSTTGTPSNVKATLRLTN